MPTEIANSSYLDLNSYRSTADPLTGGTPVASFTMNVALVFERANDPTALLNSSWASRHSQLDAHNQAGTLWSTFGANQANYNQVLTDLATMGIQTVDQVTPLNQTNGYISSAESRTIWVQLNQNTFATLFGTQLVQGPDHLKHTTTYWEGNLSLPDGWQSTLGVQGLWFDTYAFEEVVASNPGTPAKLPTGPQSLGNSSTTWTQQYPQVLAEHYNFPLTGALRDPASGQAVTTGAIGLVEPLIGSALLGGSFQNRIDDYRKLTGIHSSATVITVADGGQAYTGDDDGGERSLDVGIATAINPQSPLVLYAGSGNTFSAQSETFTAYQSAIWDTTNNINVLSSSWGFDFLQIAPGSPFLFAAQQLFVDAALRNITVLTANSDGGSGDQFGNGVTNVMNGQTSQYGLMVGGSAFSSLHEARGDTTLASIVSGALAGDQATIWQLVQGGLTTMPTTNDPLAWLVETVWNRYVLNDDGTSFADGFGYFPNLAGTGGVDLTQPIPWYQQAFGLTPTTSDSKTPLTGRGTPDVTAAAGGNTYYTVPGANMLGTTDESGTSASTPFWAALISQFNAIFVDQGLYPLGYANDLLYIAAAIAPGSFNDVTMGNNISSFTMGGPVDSGGTQITPTGHGYYAGPGYDLTSGLGSPNGVLLGRALTAIAHSQISFDTGAYPDILDQASSGWISGADQSLLFQTMAGTSATIGLDLGSTDTSFASRGSASYAWTNRFAEQAMQSDFDPKLVQLFDKQAQGRVGELSAMSGDALSLTINGVAALSTQGTLTGDFGFVEFHNTAGVVRVARAVAVAETAGGASDQTAVVRLRQGGEDSVSVSFYKVDDYTGAVGGLHAGDAGYAVQAAARAYTLSTGGTSISGAGYGQYNQALLLDVDAGDLIAMKLTNTTSNQVFWGFAGGNEAVTGTKVGHLWNYGLNTWGWEDSNGGGDNDYNDLVVQFDFTSTAGHGWLA